MCISDRYRKYFTKLASWVKPGACFGFQAILRNRIPRTRKDLEDLAFTADVIFPGGLNPRLEELTAAVNPCWEIVELRTQRESYGKRTAERLRRTLMGEVGEVGETETTAQLPAPAWIG